MLADRFLGRKPTHFQINPIVKSYIVSEAFLWAAWDFVMPIFSLFVVANIAGGNIQTAAFGFSIYLTTRVVFELISGRILAKSTDRKKLVTALIGMSLLSIGYIGFMLSKDIFHIFLFYFVNGMGLGIAAPAKNSLFAIHLDKNKEATEWGIADAVSFICMALATALGGLIASIYGFGILFIIAAAVNAIATIPYFLLLLNPTARN